MQSISTFTPVRCGVPPTHVRVTFSPAMISPNVSLNFGKSRRCAGTRACSPRWRNSRRRARGSPAGSRASGAFAPGCHPKPLHAARSAAPGPKRKACFRPESPVRSGGLRCIGEARDRRVRRGDDLLHPSRLPTGGQAFMPSPPQKHRHDGPALLRPLAREADRESRSRRGGRTRYDPLRASRTDGSRRLSVSALRRRAVRAADHVLSPSRQRRGGRPVIRARSMSSAPRPRLRRAVRSRPLRSAGRVRRRCGRRGDGRSPPPVRRCSRRTPASRSAC